jgi:signal transduction histidine kinase
MHIWPQGLYGRLALSLALILTLAMLSLGYVLVKDAEKEFNLERLEAVSSSAKVLANGSLDALVTRDYELLEFWVQAILVSDYYAYAYLSRADGRILTHSDPKQIGHQTRKLGELHAPLVRDARYRERPVREVIYPALLGNRHLANAHVAYYLNVATFADTLNPVKLGILILLFLIIMLLAVLFIVRRAMQPITRLTKVIKTQSLDEMSHGLPTAIYRYDDEISELAHTLEVMAHSLLSSFRDLQQQEALLKERVAGRTQELNLANKELEAFIYSVSHDLRAPLRAIDGFSRALQEDCEVELSEEGRDHLQRVLRNVGRMSEIIDDLLRLSRVGRSELVVGEIDLGRLAAEIIAQLQQAEPEREVEVRIQPDMVTCADPRLVRILLENLLGNAWKYTARTTPARIEFYTSTEDGKQAFCIRDNGAGFDMAHAEKLYAAFQRLHTPREFEGSGIGLTIVDRIIRRHGGWISAHSEPGQGATFCFGFEVRDAANGHDVNAVIDA